jgi:hypothetical protein
MCRHSADAFLHTTFIAVAWKEWCNSNTRAHTHQIWEYKYLDHIQPSLHRTVATIKKTQSHILPLQLHQSPKLIHISETPKHRLSLFAKKIPSLIHWCILFISLMLQSESGWLLTTPFVHLLDVALWITSAVTMNKQMIRRKKWKVYECICYIWMTDCTNMISLSTDTKCNHN